MSFNVSAKDVDSLVKSVAKYEDDLEKAMKNLSSAIDNLSGNQGFSGALATSVKAYFSEVHGAASQSLLTLAAEALAIASQYKQGYTGIDGSATFHLTDASLSAASSQMASFKGGVESASGSLAAQISSIRDIISIANPSMASLDNSLATTQANADDTNNKVSAHEQNSMQNAKRIGDLASSLSSFLDGQGAHPTGGVGYVPGSVFESPAYQALIGSLGSAVDVVSQSESVIQAALKSVEKNDEIRQKIAEAEQRKKDGVWQLIAGGLALVGTVAVCVLTCGAGVPVVLAVGGALLAGAFDASEMAEGAGKWYYGAKGDATTKVINPVRDWLMGGNQKAYDTASFWVHTVDCAIAPVGGAVNLARASTTVGGKALALGRVALEQGAGYAGGKLFGEASDAIFEKFGASQYESAAFQNAIGLKGSMKGMKGPHEDTFHHTTEDLEGSKGKHAWVDPDRPVRGTEADIKAYQIGKDLHEIRDWAFDAVFLPAYSHQDAAKNFAIKGTGHQDTVFSHDAPAHRDSAGQERAKNSTGEAMHSSSSDSQLRTEHFGQTDPTDTAKDERRTESAESKHSSVGGNGSRNGAVQSDRSQFDKIDKSDESRNTDATNKSNNNGKLNRDNAASPVSSNRSSEHPARPEQGQTNVGDSRNNAVSSHDTGQSSNEGSIPRQGSESKSPASVGQGGVVHETANKLADGGAQADLHPTTDDNGVKNGGMGQPDDVKPTDANGSDAANAGANRPNGDVSGNTKADVNDKVEHADGSEKGNAHTADASVKDDGTVKSDKEDSVAKGDDAIKSNQADSAAKDTEYSKENRSARSDKSSHSAEKTESKSAIGSEGDANKSGESKNSGGVHHGVSDSHDTRKDNTQAGDVAEDAKPNTNANGIKQPEHDGIIDGAADSSHHNVSKDWAATGSQDEGGSSSSQAAGHVAAADTFVKVVDGHPVDSCGTLLQDPSGENRPWHQDNYADLRDAGASEADARRMAWWNKPPSGEQYQKYEYQYNSVIDPKDPAAPYKLDADGSILRDPDGNPIKEQHWIDPVTGEAHYPRQAGFELGKGEKLETQVMERGQLLDRIGGEDGGYLATVDDPAHQGAPLDERSVAPWSKRSSRHLYVVVNEFKALRGQAAPAFGDPGGAEQVIVPKDPHEGGYTGEDLSRLGTDKVTPEDQLNTVADMVDKNCEKMSGREYDSIHDLVADFSKEDTNKGLIEVHYNEEGKIVVGPPPESESGPGKS
ncbi:TNT domain-containing protein [Bifidobacterium sp. ESL0784]|uniref:TNT domain-containing protein n=1 Tax=Bifidobacterium sp. ESL0784 TaxID=2983231 RepID=UPI0023F9A0BE|nr:TNT domain-containing protein [Bifidobacterium sp. ESL0784]MDF7641248.1 TNT domain-containing protein [Bifidobacterium sp. ESL0784]